MSTQTILFKARVLSNRIKTSKYIHDWKYNTFDMWVAHICIGAGIGGFIGSIYQANVYYTDCKIYKNKLKPSDLITNSIMGMGAGVGVGIFSGIVAPFVLPILIPTVVPYIVYDKITNKKENAK